MWGEDEVWAFEQQPVVCGYVNGGQLGMKDDHRQVGMLPTPSRAASSWDVRECEGGGVVIAR